MTDIAIRAEGIAKQYDLGVRNAPYQTLREAIATAVTAPIKRFRRLSGHVEEQEKFWALSDVSFEVKSGEVLGLVGRNGAGKSTLLKVIGRITEPTKGRLTLRGRVASLLEVGTGFHPELTGRENIFLNGAILGMSRAEILRKFDEIVAFAEVEKFLDTPVKRYSSGMYVRLAFAVASNLEPDILLIDEVLAVGDLQFQRKCLDQMKGLAGGETTIVFVSHNMAAIHALCNRCLLLDQGRSIAVGPTAEIVARYVEHHAPTQQFERDLVPIGRPAITAASLAVDALEPDRPGTLLRVTMRIVSPERANVGVWLRFKDSMGMPIAFAGAGQFGADDIVELSPGENNLEFAVAVETLALGDYMLNITTIIPGVRIIEELDDCLRFSLERAPRRGATRALEQSWGYGSVELPITRVRTRALTPGSAVRPSLATEAETAVGKTAEIKRFPQ